MLLDKTTMLIFSCQKFSDLWDAHVLQLEKYWGDRPMKTYIVTDEENPRNYEKVEIRAAGKGKEFSERLEFILNQVETEYVFVTLDDYFLIEKIDNDKIEGLIEMMRKEKLDYVRLFPRPKRATGEPLSDYKNVFRIINEVGYSVNLYSGIWRTDFMKKTVREVKDPWRYEVSLSAIASELNAACAVSNNREFVILDVVRKGKILNKANRYFKKHNIYHGDREVHSYWYEIKLAIRTFGRRHMPRWMVNAARNFMIKRGHHYFSQDS